MNFSFLERPSFHGSDIFFIPNSAENPSGPLSIKYIQNRPTDCTQLGLGFFPRKQSGPLSSLKRERERFVSWWDAGEDVGASLHPQYGEKGNAEEGLLNQTRFFLSPSLHLQTGTNSLGRSGDSTEFAFYLPEGWKFETFSRRDGYKLQSAVSGALIQYNASIIAPWRIETKLSHYV